MVLPAPVPSRNHNFHKTTEVTAELRHMYTQVDFEPSNFVTRIDNLGLGLPSNSIRKDGRCASRDVFSSAEGGLSSPPNSPALFDMLMPFS